MRDNDIFKIMQWVTIQNQYLTEVDDPSTRDLFHVSHILSKTLRKYIFAFGGSCWRQRTMKAAIQNLSDDKWMVEQPRALWAYIFVHTSEAVIIVKL